MRYVVSRSDVMHMWANQTQDRAEEQGGRRTFFEDGVIFSYGRHFPMACHLDKDTVAITTRSYSNTTSKHLWDVRSAASHKNIIYCHDIPTDGKSFHHHRNIDHWCNEVKNLLEKLARARKKESYLAEIQRTQAGAEKYIEYFKLKLNKDQKARLYAANREEVMAAAIKQQKAEAAKKRELTKKGKALHPDWLEAWRNFNEWEFNRELEWPVRRAIEAAENDWKQEDDNRVRLRTDGEKVYTSKSIQLPVAVAERYFKRYLAMVELGGCNGDCKFKMLDFEVRIMSADKLVVGCHNIARSEIDYIATKLGWLAVPDMGLAVNKDGAIEEL